MREGGMSQENANGRIAYDAIGSLGLGADLDGAISGVALVDKVYKIKEIKHEAQQILSRRTETRSPSEERKQQRHRADLPSFKK